MTLLIIILFSREGCFHLFAISFYFEALIIFTALDEISASNSFLNI